MLRRNLIIILMSLELMLNAANLSLVAFSRFRVGANGLPDYNAQVFVFFVITVAAAEVAVGLALLVARYIRARQTTDVGDITSLKLNPRLRRSNELILSVADPPRTVRERDGHHALHAPMEIIEQCDFYHRGARKFLLQLLDLRSISPRLHVPSSCGSISRRSFECRLA